MRTWRQPLEVWLKAVDKWWAKRQAGGREALVMRPRGKLLRVHQVLGEAEQAVRRVSPAILRVALTEFGGGEGQQLRQLWGSEVPGSS